LLPRTLSSEGGTELGGEAKQSTAMASRFRAMTGDLNRFHPDVKKRYEYEMKKKPSSAGTVGSRPEVADLDQPPPLPPPPREEVLPNPLHEKKKEKKKRDSLADFVYEQRESREEDFFESKRAAIKASKSALTEEEREEEETKRKAADERKKKHVSHVAKLAHSTSSMGNASPRGGGRGGGGSGRGRGGGGASTRAQPLDRSLSSFQRSLNAEEPEAATSDWKKLTDPDSGHAYWENLATGQTQWEDPQA